MFLTDDSQDTEPNQIPPHNLAELLHLSKRIKDLEKTVQNIGEKTNSREALLRQLSTDVYRTNYITKEQLTASMRENGEILNEGIRIKLEEFTEAIDAVVRKKMEKGAVEKIFTDKMREFDVIKLWRDIKEQHEMQMSEFMERSNHHTKLMQAELDAKVSIEQLNKLRGNIVEHSEFIDLVTRVVKLEGSRFETEDDPGTYKSLNDSEDNTTNSEGRKRVETREKRREKSRSKELSNSPEVSPPSSVHTPTLHSLVRRVPQREPPSLQLDIAKIEQLDEGNSPMCKSPASSLYSPGSPIRMPEFPSVLENTREELESYPTQEISQIPEDSSRRARSPQSPQSPGFSAFSASGDMGKIYKALKGLNSQMKIVKKEQAHHQTSLLDVMEGAALLKERMDSAFISTAAFEHDDEIPLKLRLKIINRIEEMGSRVIAQGPMKKLDLIAGNMGRDVLIMKDELRNVVNEKFKRLIFMETEISRISKSFDLTARSLKEGERGIEKERREIRETNKRIRLQFGAIEEKLDQVEEDMENKTERLRGIIEKISSPIMKEYNKMKMEIDSYQHELTRHQGQYREMCIKIGELNSNLATVRGSPNEEDPTFYSTIQGRSHSPFRLSSALGASKSPSPHTLTAISPFSLPVTSRIGSALNNPISRLHSSGEGVPTRRLLTTGTDRSPKVPHPYISRKAGKRSRSQLSTSFGGATVGVRSPQSLLTSKKPQGKGVLKNIRIKDFEIALNHRKEGSIHGEITLTTPDVYKMISQPTTMRKKEGLLDSERSEMIEGDESMKELGNMLREIKIRGKLNRPTDIRRYGEPLKLERFDIK